MYMKISFVLQVASHARYWRRVDKLKELGVSVDVFSFERDYYRGSLEKRVFTSLGRVQRENYLSRIFPLVKAISIMKKKIIDSDVIYSFGIDTFIIGWLASRSTKKKVIYIYEIGDIRSILLRNDLIGKVMRGVEKIVLKKADLLVVTSSAYIDNYFKKIQHINDIDYIVIENKPELEQKNHVSEITIKDTKKITIGYFGVIRCRRSLEILIKMMRQKNGKFNLYIRGIPSGTEDLLDDIKSIEGVVVDGEYTVPDDLYEMYKHIDVSWICYPYQGERQGNWSWAKTTRFYEACFFKKPMIAQSNTQDGEYITKKGIGIEIPLSDIDQAVKMICSLSKEKIEKMTQNIINVPEKIYTYTDEHQILIDKIEIKLVKN